MLLHKKVGTGEADERVDEGNCKNSPETYRTLLLTVAAVQEVAKEAGPIILGWVTSCAWTPCPSSQGSPTELSPWSRSTAATVSKGPGRRTFLNARSPVHCITQCFFGPSPVLLTRQMSRPSRPDAAQIQADRRPVQMRPKREAVSAPPNKNHLLPVRHEDTAVVV